MPIMLLNPEKSLFFNAYISVTFGKRKWPIFASQAII
jgi:hypothetical protein